eukprot:802635-Rhodomonas_salina.2
MVSNSRSWLWSASLMWMQHRLLCAHARTHGYEQGPKRPARGSPTAYMSRSQCGHPISSKTSSVSSVLTPDAKNPVARNHVRGTCTCWIASTNGIRRLSITYATTTAAERERPALQCTRILPPLSNAALMFRLHSARGQGARTRERENARCQRCTETTTS